MGEASQRRALRATLARANAVAAASSDKTHALIAAVKDMRQRFNAEIDAVLFNLETMEAELMAAAIDTTTLADPPRKPRAKKRAAAATAPKAAPPKRARDVKRAAANDRDDELPLPAPTPRRAHR